MDGVHSAADFPSLFDSLAQLDNELQSPKVLYGTYLAICRLTGSNPNYCQVPFPPLPLPEHQQAIWDRIYLQLLMLPLEPEFCTTAQEVLEFQTYWTALNSDLRLRCQDMINLIQSGNENSTTNQSAAQVGDGIGQQNANSTDNSDDDDDDADGEQDEEFNLPGYNVVRDEQVVIDRFNFIGREVEIHLPSRQNPIAALDALHNLMSLLLDSCRTGDMVAITLSAPEQPGLSIELPFRPADQLMPGSVMQMIESEQQSADEILLHGNLIVTFQRVHMPHGAGRNKRGIASLKAYTAQSQSFIRIRNDDNLCLAAALCMARAHDAVKESRDLGEPEDVRQQKEVFYKRTRNSVPQTLARFAREYMVGCNITEAECGSLQSVQKFQDQMPRHRIIVFGSFPAPHKVFDGPALRANGEMRRPLYLHLEDNHYDVITKPHSAFECAYYCDSCVKFFNNKNLHNCTKVCSSCRNASPPCRQHQQQQQQQQQPIQCDTCLRFFPNATCMANHKKAIQGGKTTCELVKVCNTCLVHLDYLRRKDRHVCGEIYCAVCSKYTPSGHLCYMQIDRNRKDKPTAAASSNTSDANTSDDNPPPLAKISKQIPFVIIFYDLESIQTEKVDGGEALKHQAVLCISQQVCPACIENDSLQFVCTDCGEREHTFMGTDCIVRFLDFVSEQFGMTKEAVIVAHNGRSYDHQFVLKEFIRRKWKPKLIVKGTKITLMEYKNLRFIDSINFLQMALAKFPSTFGISELKKGYFPHFLFNVVSDHRFDANNAAATNYVIQGMPPIAAYEPQKMTPSAQQEFCKWYDQECGKHLEFNYVRELKSYCSSDVTLLRLGCLHLRTFFLQFDVDPLRECCTIANACNKVFRRTLLRPNTIGIIPAGGYRAADKQSLIALEWLHWKENETGEAIETAATGREVRILGMKVDGFQPATGTIYEFDGCYFHGCPACFRKRDTNLVNTGHDTPESRYQATKVKKARLEASGYHVESIWECEFRRLKQERDDISAFIAGNPPPSIVNIMEPRKALAGGRTNAIKLYHLCSNGEIIRYADVCSLYPWVCKFGIFPVGHPVIHLKDFPDINSIIGLISCKVLAPKKLLHPLLPFHVDKKLLFPLCNACAHEKRQASCNHSDAARSFSGVFVTLEIHKALQLGYKIVETYEVWEYNRMQYDRQDPNTGLMTPYIMKMEAIKIQASGPPSSCQTPDEIMTFVRQYKEREGVDLDPTKLQFNAGMRSLGKIAMNSFWGRLAMRENLNNVEIIYEPSDLYEKLLDPDVQVSSLIPLPEDNSLVMKWKYDADVAQVQPTTNHVLASFVTAQARLKLYSFIEQLQQRVLYFDTDSVFYILKPGDKDLEFGHFLGELTDELATYGPGTYIEEFVSGGPKNYAFRTITPGTGKQNVMVKVKGIMLNSENLEKINFKVMKKLILEDSPDSVAVSTKQIKRNNQFDVLTEERQKLYKIHYDKRRRIANFETLPYGYVDDDDDNDDDDDDDDDDDL